MHVPIRDQSVLTKARAQDVHIAVHRRRDLDVTNRDHRDQLHERAACGMASATTARHAKGCEWSERGCEHGEREGERVFVLSERGASALLSVYAHTNSQKSLHGQTFEFEPPILGSSKNRVFFCSKARHSL